MQRPVQRIDGLTGLRMVAAVLVLLSHEPELVPLGSAHSTLERIGPAGVTIFFVLSGLLLTVRYSGQFAHGSGSDTLGSPRYRSFLRARVARIVPLYLVALIVMTPLTWSVTDFPSPTKAAVSWVANATLVQSLIPTLLFHQWNMPAWSISAEMCFYVLFPFFIGAVVRRSRRQPATMLAAFVVSGALYAATAITATRLLERSGKDDETIANMIERLKFFPGLRIWEFVAGCAAGAVLLQVRDGGPVGRWGRALARRQIRNIAIVIAVGGFVLVAALSGAARPTSGRLVDQFLTSGAYTLYLPFAVLLVASIASGPTAAHRLLDRPLVQLFGEASYAFYVLQFVMVRLLDRVDPQPRPFSLAVIGVTGLTAASILSLRLIEIPARRYLRAERSTTRNEVAMSTTRATSSESRSG